MIVTSCQQAISILPELKLPVIIVATRGGEPLPLVAFKPRSEKDFKKTVYQLMLMDGAELVITGEAGDDPRL